MSEKHTYIHHELFVRPGAGGVVVVGVWLFGVLPVTVSYKLYRLCLIT